MIIPTDELIIDCAISLGFEISKTYSKHLTTIMEGSNFQFHEIVESKCTKKDVRVYRATTNVISGSKDLGEWWVSNPSQATQFRVTDTDFKKYSRTININKLI